MTVVAVFPVLQRPWKGYSDPGLPVGMWIGQGSILGDMTGGDQIVFLIFKPEGDPLGARFYNIEQVEVHDTSGASINAGLSINNFDIISSTGLINRRIHIDLNFDGVSNTMLNSGSLRLPIFLGRPQLVDLEAQLALNTINVVNQTLFFTAQGYIWEPRSLLMDGGLRRPLDSLYG